MKRITVTFVLLVLATLMILPSVNLAWRGFENSEQRRWWDKSSLYSFDIVLPAVSSLLFPLGISIRPEHVVVGKDGWLLLGDWYERNLSRRRSGAQKNEIQLAHSVRNAMGHWRNWMQERGVRAFKFMVAPNKETIYPEFLPDWTKMVPPSFLDELMRGADSRVFFDGRESLRTVRDFYDQPAFYQCDTHWNPVGAAAFFYFFMQDLQREPVGADLMILKREQFGVEVMDYFTSVTDLANMLDMHGLECDKQRRVHINIDRLIETEIYDFNDMRLLRAGGNPPSHAPFTPELIRSKDALNNKKVLWLRDSFGVDMSPLMAMTFTEILQIHYAVVTSDMLEHFVSTFHPDYVFIMVVERDALNEAFVRGPNQFAARESAETK